MISTRLQDYLSGQIKAPPGYYAAQVSGVRLQQAPKPPDAFERLKLGHNGHWPDALNRAAIRRLPAVQP